MKLSVSYLALYCWLLYCFKVVFCLFYSGLLFVAVMKSVDEMAVFLVEVRKSRTLSNKMCTCGLE